MDIPDVFKGSTTQKSASGQAIHTDYTDRQKPLRTQCEELFDRLEDIDRDCDCELSNKGREQAIDMLLEFAIRLSASRL